MAEPETSSIPALFRGVLDDARELIREEIALLRAEIREEASAAQKAGIALAAAGLLATMGAVLLCIAIGSAIAYFFNAPTWVGYGVVSLLLGAAAYLCVNRGRAGLANVRGLPKTKESLRENMVWIQSKSSGR